MKAVILAAGKSQRLSSLQLSIPKPLLNYKDKPLLQYHIEKCAAVGIKDIYINLHHLPQTIKDYFGNGKKYGVNISYHLEPELLGTGGAIKSFEKALANEPTLIIYGDNYWDYSLSEIIRAHPTTADMSIVLFEKQDVTQSGVAETDAHGMIVKFFEKPAAPVTSSKWVSAGIYILSPQLLNEIPSGFSDFGKDLIPGFITAGKKLYGIKMSTPVIAVDTPELAKQAGVQ